MELPRARIRLERRVRQMKLLEASKVIEPGLRTEGHAKAARIFEGALRPAEAALGGQERQHAVLRRMPEGQMARGRAFVAAGEHAASVQRRNAQGIGGFLRGPMQKFPACGGDTEGAADRARPPAAPEEVRRFDAGTAPTP